MPSFDISNKPDFQKLDNSVQVAKKEISTRFDFKDSQSEIELDQKNKMIQVSSASELKMDAIVDVLLSRMVKQGVDPKTIDISKDIIHSGKMYRKSIPIKDGIDKETAKKIVKQIKESGLKVQASIMDDIIRVTGKKIDDLQSVITLVRQSSLEVPIQVINMKS
jgi:uncharacterized protein YajQ (UPF0234 family)